MTETKNHQIRYVFWDSDNTLVETAEHHWRKHVETLKTHNIDLDAQYRKRIYENNGTQNHEWLQAELGLKESQSDYLAQIDAWYFDHIHEIQIRSGVRKAIKYFKDNGLKQAVVSNGRRKSVMAALDAKDLSPNFEFILCKEDYEGRKPDPTPYLTAMARMREIENEDIQPANCLVIEDDPLGVQAGEAAGMAVLFRPIGDKTPFDLMIG